MIKAQTAAQTGEVVELKNIVIVGSSASIGSAIVERFRSPAIRMIATYFSQNRIPTANNIHTLCLDLTSAESIEKFATELGGLMPQIDLAIFLAGLLPGKNLEQYTSIEMDQVLAVNFTGQAKVIKRLLPFFKSGSQIIMLSSISAQRGSFDPIYAAAKGAVLSFVKALAANLSGVRINAIAPGLIHDSTMFQNMAESRREFHRQQTAGKQLLQIQDLAEIIFDLSQPHWAHLNGACIDLNGGQYVR
jgi:NAD(P)-dependent dehydrogenase (short-subunit alcohol dehydrogenase family)